MLKVHTRNLGDVAILCLQGRLVSGETRALREAVHAQSNVDVLVLDLARVTAIDARGLGVMLELRRQSAVKGIRFKLMNVSKFTRRVLEITRLDSVFDIIPKAEEIVPKAEPSTARTAHTRVLFAACA